MEMIVNPTAKPDFASMKLDELLAAYNSMSETHRKAAFRNKENGALQCENRWNALVGKILTAPVTEATLGTIEDALAQGAAVKIKDLPTRPAKIVEKKVPMIAKKDKKPHPETPEVTATPTKSGDLRVIKRLAAVNPRRPGTDAHRTFEEMVPGRSVADYLLRFDADWRRTARQWLWNTCRDGHVSLEGTK